MTKQAELATIYETYVEDQLLYADHETDDEFIERFLGPFAAQDDSHAEEPWELNWECTHRERLPSD